MFLLVLCGGGAAFDVFESFESFASLVVVVEIGVPPMIGLILEVLSLNVVMSLLLDLHGSAKVQTMQGMTPH